MHAGPEATISVWGTWTPIAAIPALVVVASVIGGLRPSAGGFLPYVLRWVFVGCGLGLLAWIASDIAAAPTREPSTVVGEGVKAEREVAQALASASTPQQRQRLEQAMVAARAGETLGIALDRARERGVDVPVSPAQVDAPTGDLVADHAPAGAAGMQEITALLLEYGEELAAGEVPEEVASFIEDAGLDQQLLQQAALFLASRAIAYYFGAPYAVVFELLVALLDDGEITLGELVRLGAACGMAFTADGIDAERLLESFEQLGVQAQTAVAVMERLEAADVDVPEPLLTLAKEMAGSDTEPAGACDEGAIRRAFEAAGCGSGAAGCEPDRVDGFLQHSEVASCRQKKRTERRALIVEHARQNHPDLAPAFERAWK